MATLGDKFVAFNGEKYAWNIRVCCQGTSGDAELLLDDTPGERMSRVLQKFFAFRTMEMEKLTANPDWTLANVISINLTKIEGGGRRNMVPSEFVLYFDCRIPFERMDVDELEPTMDQWCHDVSNSVLIDYTLQELPINPTRINDPYWVTFEKAVEEVEVQMFPGRTDSRHLRNAEIPVVSFSPIINTPVRLHGHDEHIGIQTFLDGITIYCRILRELGELME
ncbi:aminoacylase-1A-like [Zophobas morio]